MQESKGSRLEGVSIASPCSRRWSELLGQGKQRYCDSCRLHVTNLSAMTPVEAEAFLAGSSGRTCVTYVPDDDGRVRTARPRRPSAPHWPLRLARVASALVGLLALLPGCRPGSSGPSAPGGAQGGTGGEPGDETRLMGEVECEDDVDSLRVLGGLSEEDFGPAPHLEPTIMGRLAPPGTVPTFEGPGDEPR